MAQAQIMPGDALTVLGTLPAASVQCVVTSPPYYGLRSYLPDVVRLRDDLSDEARAYVLAELDRLGINPIRDVV